MGGNQSTNRISDTSTQLLLDHDGCQGSSSGTLARSELIFAILDQLPLELVEHILYFLSAIELLLLSSTCKEFFVRCQDARIWRSLCRELCISLNIQADPHLCVPEKEEELARVPMLVGAAGNSCALIKNARDESTQRYKWLYRHISRTPQRRRFSLLLSTLQPRVIQADTVFYDSQSVLLPPQLVQRTQNSHRLTDRMCILACFTLKSTPIKKKKKSSAGAEETESEDHTLNEEAIVAKNAAPTSVLESGCTAHLQLMSARYFVDGKAPLYKAGYRLPVRVYAQCDGEALKSWLQEAIRDFAEYYRKYDHKDRRRARGNYVGRKILMVGSGGKKARIGAGYIAEFRNKLRKSACLPISLPLHKSKSERVIILLDVCISNHQRWRVHQSRERWAYDTKLRIIKDALAHFVCDKLFVDAYTEFGFGRICENSIVMDHWPDDDIESMITALFEAQPRHPPKVLLDKNVASEQRRHRNGRKGLEPHQNPNPNESQASIDEVERRRPQNRVETGGVPDDMPYELHHRIEVESIQSLIKKMCHRYYASYGLHIEEDAESTASISPRDASFSPSSKRPESSAPPPSPNTNALSVKRGSSSDIPSSAADAWREPASSAVPMAVDLGSSTVVETSSEAKEEEKSHKSSKKSIRLVRRLKSPRDRHGHKKKEKEEEEEKDEGNGEHSIEEIDERERKRPLRVIIVYARSGLLPIPPSMEKQASYDCLREQLGSSLRVDLYQTRTDRMTTTTTRGRTALEVLGTHLRSSLRAADEAEPSAIHLHRCAALFAWHAEQRGKTVLNRRLPPHQPLEKRTSMGWHVSI